MFIKFFKCCVDIYAFQQGDRGGSGGPYLVGACSLLMLTFAESSFLSLCTLILPWMLA